MSNFIQSNPLLRIRNQLRRHGLRAIIDKVAQRARKKVYLDETHVWYELPLVSERPRVKLLAGLELVRGGPSELPLLAELPTVGQLEARQRMKSNADLWLVLRGRQPAFACWVFHGSVALPAAPNGRLMLPPEIAFFEDSVTSSAFRGRGIPLAAWPRIADHLEQTAVRSVVTKVEEDNGVARRAFEKAGFREFATTRFRRVGLRRYTTVRAGTGATVDWLAGQLTPRQPGPNVASTGSPALRQDSSRA